jgi:hypothetical protein
MNELERIAEERRKDPNYDAKMEKIAKEQSLYN